MSFSALKLSEPLLKVLSEQNYLQPFPIQEKVIPAVINDKDVLGIAQTGSGKTASFVLPILEKLQWEEALPNRHIKVLVLVPTRELAVQVNEVFVLFAKYLPHKIKSMAVFGGVSINLQMKNLMGVEILVATPGRLLDLVASKVLYLSQVKILVLDEADKMLNLGFKEEMTTIFSMLPTKRQNLLFSATLGKDVNTINEFLLHNPVKIKVEEEEGQNLNLIKQIAYKVSEEKKGPLLRYLIKKNNLQQVLIFTSSVQRADAVALKLRSNDIEAWVIHSKKSQEARSEALRRFKTGKLRVLVGTDLISRGIDIKFLPCVINYELPRSPKDYIHRIGRTGRAESPGEAISLVSVDEEHHFRVIQKKMGKWVDFIDAEGIDLKGF